MSKRIAVAILVFLISGSACVFAYDQEIRYQGLEWGASVSEVNAALSKVGLKKTDEKSTQLPEYWLYYSDPYDWFLYDWSSSYWDTDGYEMSYSRYKTSMQSIAGHSLENWTASFSKGNGDDWKFYMIVFSLYFDTLSADKECLGAYEDLKTKLTNLYGEGTSNENFKTLKSDESGFTYEYYTEWKGANNTGIHLEFTIYINKRSTVYSRNINVKLIYGKTDDQLLKDAYELKIKKQQEEEARAKEELSNNYSGL